jgi:hypothetical protein
MKKYIFAALAALTLGGVALTQPAQARVCHWNGFVEVCHPGPGPGAWWWRHHYYRPYVYHYRYWPY